MTTTLAVRENGAIPKLTTRELEASAGTLPVLGYSVQWNLAHVEIAHKELVRSLQTAGFSTIQPERPSPTLALRRALARWVQNRAMAATLPCPRVVEAEGYDSFAEDEDEEGDEAYTGEKHAKSKRKAHKSLLRKINSPQSEWLVFGLVIEQLDLAQLGLSYATRLRVFLHKKTLAIRVSEEEAGLQPDDLAQIGDADEGQGEEDTLAPGLKVITKEIHQLFEYYREHHQAQDISRLLKQLVGGLDSFSLRWLGGVYFVPQQHQLALEQLYQLVENLPATAGHLSDKFMLRLPILDGAGAKKQLAQAAHREFLEELTTLEADLNRLSQEATHHQLRAETVARRLTNYRELKAKAEVYAELLDMQQERIMAMLGQLSTQATQLLDTLSDPTPQEAAEQQAFDWDELDLSYPQTQSHQHLELSLIGA